MAEVSTGLGSKGAPGGSVGELADDIQAHELGPACARAAGSFCFMVLRDIHEDFNLDADLF